MKKLLPLIYLFLQTVCIAQFDYPPAVEKWSEPVRVDTFSLQYDFEEGPFLTPNMDTMYFYRNDAIYMSVMKDSTWQAPIRLNSYINNDMPIRTPTISKDGKRLYYSGWGGYGNWDLWYSDWDELTKDWGPSYNMGPSVNTQGGEYYLYEVSKDTIYVITDRIALSGVCKFKWVNATQDWQLVDSFYYHFLGSSDFRGISITEDGKKLYFSKWIHVDSLKTELGVCYWDSETNNWGEPQLLNINTIAKGYIINPETEYMGWLGGFEEYPWISPDGRFLYFSSNRPRSIMDTLYSDDTFISKLIIDEHGDSVIGVRDYREENITPKTAVLYPCYPNPFNPVTTISYELFKSAKINLSIYDSIGRLVQELVSGEKSIGRHTVTFNAANLGSGVYYYRLTVDGLFLTNKFVLLK